ncbi:MAG: hypothetical protein ACI4SF_13985 [Oscillospiraceae bacterium]
MAYRENILKKKSYEFRIVPQYKSLERVEEMTRNNSDRKNKSLNGVVLIMVVTVMFVLIIMLLATLSVVSTAQNRYYTKYEENQAYYTARSALDVFTQNILNDDKYYAYDESGSTPRTYKYTTVDMSKTPSEKAAAQSADTYMKQGLAMEFEMYKIPAQNDAGYASNFEEGDYIFGETSAIAEDKNYSIDTAIDKDEGITYKITFPQMSNGTDQYGRFVDTDASTSEQVASIKVTIVDRRYNFGGPNADAFSAMTDAQLKQCSEGNVSITDGATTTVYTDAQLVEAVRLGDRLKDKMRLRIESTVSFMDVEGTAVLYYDTSEKPAVNSSNAITSISDISQSSGVFPIGGASGLSGGLSIDQDSVICGSLYITGNSDTTNNTNDLRDSKIYMFGDTLHTFRGGITYSNSYPIFEEAGSIIYSTESVNLAVAQNFASPGNETNVIAQNFNFTKDGSTPTFYGKIYSDVFAITNNNSDLNITGGAYTNYVNIDAFASLEDDTVTFGSVSDMSVSAPSITVAKGFVFTVGGFTDKFEYDPLTGIITSESNPLISYAIDGVPAFNFDSSKTVQINYSDPTHYTMTSDMHKEFTLPATLAGRTENTVQIPTSKSIYSQVYKDTAFVNNPTDIGTNGDLNALVKPTINAAAVAAVDGDGNAIASDIVEGIINGTINDGNYGSYGISWYDWYDQTTSYWPTVEVRKGIKSSVDEAVNNYKATDTTYQADLTTYYSNYISGSEKAGATTTSLLDYTSGSSPISLETLDWSTIDLSDYSASDQSAIQSLGAAQVIRTSGYLQSFTRYGKVYGTYSSPIIIDATAGDIVIQLGAENGFGTNQEGNNSKLLFRGYFVVVGDGNVKFFLPDGNSSGATRNYMLGHDSASGQGFHVATYDIEKLIRGNGAMRLGNDSNATKAPNVYFYAGNAVEEITLGSPNDGFLSAYVYSPFASYQFAAGSGRTISQGTYYNGTQVISGSTSGYSIAGSIICAGYSSGNKVGVAYLNPETNTYTPGDPQFQWKAYQYARN